MSYEIDRLWADGFTLQLVDIIRQNAMHIIDIRESVLGDDISNATDMVVSVTGGDIAVRIRRNQTPFRDFTLRSQRISGAKTELQKIRDGFADWYLYAWTDKDIISEWILIDLKILRESGILDVARTEIRNIDGKTSFIVIPVRELELHGCIVSKLLS